MAIKHENIDKIVQELGISATTFWTNLLKTTQHHKIGTIKVSGKCITGSYLTQFCDEMAYIAQVTGIHLPIVLGGGVQYDKLPAYKNSGKVNGMRVTSKELIDQIMPLALENQSIVVESLKKSGVNAIPISPNALSAFLHGTEINYDDKGPYKIGEAVDTGYVGDVLDVSTKEIIAAIYNNQIPVISHIGTLYSDPNVYLNINATSAAKEVLKALQGMKLIIIGDKPILNKDGHVISAIYSEKELHELILNGTITGGMVLNANESYDVLRDLSQGSCVQLTKLKEYEGEVRSTGLLEEILGNGSGSKIEKEYDVTDYPLSAVNKKDVADMINKSFLPQEKILVSWYFEFIADKNPTIYLVNEKWGGGISYPIDGAEYICKLFTDENYQGMGVNRGIISKVLMQHGSIAWRTSNKNGKALNVFKRVMEHYGGTSHELGKYNLYTIGVPEQDKEKVIAQVSKIPDTFAYFGR